MTDAADQLITAEVYAGKALGDGGADQFIHLRALLGTAAHDAVQPAEVITHLGKGRSIAGQRAMAGHDLLPGQLLQLVEIRQPGGQARRARRGQGTLVKHQITGKQHATLHIENRQISPGVAAQGQQLQRPPAYLKHARLKCFSGQQHFGAAHPVTHQAVHVFRHGIALLCQQRGGAGQGGNRHIAEGLIAQHMVGMMMGQHDLEQRLVSDAGNRLAHRLAVATRRAAVDHHNAFIGDDKPGVDDIAAVGLGEVVRAAFKQPHTIGNLPGLQVVVERIGVHAGAGQRRQYEYPAHKHLAIRRAAPCWAAQGRTAI